MRDIITVMKFTIKDMVKRKSFIISTLIILLLIIIGFNIPNIMKNIKGEDTGNKLLIVDSENIFEGNLELLKQANLGYDIEIGEASFDEIKQKIENKEIESALLIEKQENVREISNMVSMACGKQMNIKYIINNVSQKVQATSDETIRDLANKSDIPFTMN